MAAKIDLTIDELVKYCGFFSSESKVNNYYNCNSPNSPDSELDETFKKMVGKCLRKGCPVAVLLNDEDDIMRVHDKTVLQRIKRLRK